MFAPITRSYTEGFGGLGELPDIPPYERNQGDFPISLAGNVAFLDAWQAAFDGDTFDFDYHLMWRHFRDPGYMRISEIVAEDMAALPGIGLNGNVSCQIQRVYLPSSLPMILMGRLLWDGNASIEETTTDYFAAAFGEAAELARGDLEQISDCFAPLYEDDSGILDEHRLSFDEVEIERVETVSAVVENVEERITKQREATNGPQSRSWTYLYHHTQLVTQLSAALAALGRGDEARAGARWGDAKAYAQEHEEEIHHAFDVFEFVRVYRSTFEP